MSAVNSFFEPASRKRAHATPVLRLVRGQARSRRAVKVVASLFAGLLLLFGISPWQQTAYGEGRIIGYSPLEREQRIEAPVEGRVVQWYVREGSRVKQGEPIADLLDNDPNLVLRISEERDAIKKRLEAAQARVSAGNSRLKALEASRKAATNAAALRVRMAADRVTAASKAVEASEANVKTARLNLERQQALVEKGITGRRSLELAELDDTRATTDLDRAIAQQALAESEQSALAADRFKVEADAHAQLEDARAAIASAESEVANARVELARTETRLARQGAQAVKAPRDGTILRLVKFQGGELVKAGDPLAVLIPVVNERAVELWVPGRDVALLRDGMHVRLQFEGWPALQFSGWPSAAVGTFGGRVVVVDATGDAKGQFRVVVVPDGHEPWPSEQFLRQGTRANGFLLLGRVTLAYELWRQFNGFPPAPPELTTEDKS